jgi:hypothetical protein
MKRIHPMELEDKTYLNDDKNFKWAREIFETKQHKFRNRSFQQIRRKFEIRILERFLVWTSSLKDIESRLNRSIDFLTNSKILVLKGNYGYSHYVLFRFIRGLFYLSLITGLLIAIFIITPQITYKTDERYINASEPLKSCSNFSDRNALLANNNQALLTECCVKNYRSYLKKIVSQEDTLQILIDVLQGTVSVQKIILTISLINKIIILGFYGRHIFVLWLLQ